MTSGLLCENPTLKVIQERMISGEPVLVKSFCYAFCKVVCSINLVADITIATEML